MKLNVASSLRLFSVVFLAGSVLLSLPSAALAQDDDAFKAGLQARNDKKWQEVVTQMRRAIQVSPQENTRKIRSGIIGFLGGGGMEYLPHFFLGEALYNLDNCAGAVEEWAKSEQQGALRSRADLFAFVQKGYAACEMKGVLPPSKYDVELARTRQLVTGVNNQATAVNRVGTANVELFQGATFQQYKNAYADIQTANARLDAASKTRAAADFAEANAAADRARTILTTLENTLASAIAQRMSVQAQANDIEQALTAADAFDRTIEAKKAYLTQALSATRVQGRDALTRAREQLNAGRKSSNAAALGDARTLTQDGTARLKQVADELTRIEHEGLLRQLADAAARAHEAFSLVDGGFANLERLAAERPGTGSAEIPAKKEALQRQVASARRRLDSAIKSENLPGIVDAGRQASDVNAQLNDLVSSFGPLTLADRGVHPALIEGTRLYFAGQYQEALAALNPEGGFAPDLPLQLHVHLFRAAAAYALFVRSGETKEALRLQALEEIAQCKQLDSSFEPDRRAFTPRFIAVFHAGTIAAAKTASAGAQ